MLRAKQTSISVFRCLTRSDRQLSKKNILRKWLPFSKYEQAGKHKTNSRTPILKAKNLMTNYTKTKATLKSRFEALGILNLLNPGAANKHKFNVSGLMSAVLTSLNEDQSVNVEVIPAYANYLVSNGIKSILGEHMSLSVEERKRIIDAWTHAGCACDLHVQVQVGGAPCHDVLHLTEYCVSKGVNSILTLPDLYYKPTSVKALVDYVEMVAKAARGLPVMYYHNPKHTYTRISMPKFVKVASTRIPNFKGIKFTSNDLAEAALVLKVVKDDRKILLGGESVLASSNLMGIDTCVSPVINLFPCLMHNIIDAVQRGEPANAKRWQDMLSTIVQDISVEGGRIPAMKVAMECISGIKMGPPALPIRPVTDKNRKNIHNKIKKFMRK